ncbi:hypothetical protein BU23DRAFT_324820 [Bimuria novae-zelandiae CBS 107.79]|uniref:Uncharacterized protein n=1 Tax=Bimuria novae-zelandiae CBS 107.79 TaxID=1447943 RepID=A0A6A5UNQ0_9PLEO|nr:hypothetical protein BU23DRAFT_324820 [Bimuria novae-zelandiae CBS 107.79]
MTPSIANSLARFWVAQRCLLSFHVPCRGAIIYTSITALALEETFRLDRRIPEKASRDATSGLRAISPRAP